MGFVKKSISGLLNRRSSAAVLITILIVKDAALISNHTLNYIE